MDLARRCHAVTAAPAASETRSTWAESTRMYAQLSTNSPPTALATNPIKTLKAATAGNAQRRMGIRRDATPIRAPAATGKTSFITTSFSGMYVTDAFGLVNALSRRAGTFSHNAPLARSAGWGHWYVASDYLL